MAHNLEESIAFMTAQELSDLLKGLEKPSSKTEIYKKFEEALYKKISDATAPVDMSKHVHEWFPLTDKMQGCACGTCKDTASDKIVAVLQGQAMQGLGVDQGILDEVADLDPLSIEAMAKMMAGSTGKFLDNQITKAMDFTPAIADDFVLCQKCDGPAELCGHLPNGASLFPLGPSVYGKDGVCKTCKGQPAGLADKSICSACHDYSKTSELKAVFTEAQIILMKAMWVKAHNVDEPNTYGVDVGKPGGDKTVVAHLMGQKIMFHEVPNASIKDSMIEYHGKLYVATNLHQDDSANELTIKGASIPNSLMLSAVEKAVTKGILSMKGFPKKPNKWDGEKWTAEEVIGPALANEQDVLDLTYGPQGHSKFLALETIAEGAKLYLYGPKMVTSKPKPGQIIHIGYACHSVLQGEEVWVSKAVVPPVPDGTGNINTVNLGESVSDVDETTITIFGEELCSMSFGDNIHKTGPIGTLKAWCLGGTLIRFEFTGGGVVVAHKALLAGPEARVRTRRHANPDGSSTYFLEHAPDTSITSKWECLTFQQAGIATKFGQKMTETVSANLLKSGGTGVAFEQNGRKLMEFTADGKIMVYGNTFFVLNGKTVNMQAEGFAKEFWSAVAEHNPLKVELKVTKAKLGHVMTKIHDITQAYEVTQETLKALLAERTVKNYDPKADPARARFANVAEMLDVDEQSE